ncbi:hypothetical protein PmNV_049 [Penaeus monodon nudivirus]|uniref:RING-type domain-containing protein n=1 Tax=Penaeus monodon nudivirus TaxID=1529056 RepID=A0A076FC96_9VIRU|nr:hypothetical protein PmNV_049 [Penaeus monodon nudivirus]AII15837.1 hypothetical protein PmNV_049 [Penaeus monodon nudivirus]
MPATTSSQPPVLRRSERLKNIQMRDMKARIQKISKSIKEVTECIVLHWQEVKENREAIYNVQDEMKALKNSIFEIKKTIGGDESKKDILMQKINEYELKLKDKDVIFDDLFEKTLDLVKERKYVNLLVNQNLILPRFRTRLVHESLRCFICRSVALYPQLLNCGHVFCDQCICKWYDIKDTCPVCRVHISKIGFNQIDNLMEFAREILMDDKDEMTDAKKREVADMEKFIEERAN